MVSALMIRMPIGKSKVLDPIRIRSATNASPSVRDACGEEDDLALDGVSTLTMKQKTKKAMKDFRFPQDDSVLVRTVLFIAWVLAQFALIVAPYRVGFEDDGADYALGGMMVLVRVSFFVDMVPPGTIRTLLADYRASSRAQYTGDNAGPQPLQPRHPIA